jgi:hypothetical protein
MEKAEPCPACESSSKRPHSGAYSMLCLPCCTRLVLSAHPSKAQAAGMLAAIARQPGAPRCEDVVRSVNQALAKRR